MRPTRTRGDELVSLAACLFGLGWFLSRGGAPLLDPFNLEWLSASDQSVHELGWLFFQKSAWRLPLGTMTNFPEPTGTSVGYTDSIPWLALVAKIALPARLDRIQYIGPWLALCFALSAVFGARLTALCTPSRPAQVLGGAIFAVAPPLLFRVVHIALCSHWLLLAGMWLALRPLDAHTRPRRLLGWALGLVLLAGGVHPYLAAMQYCLFVALVVRLWRVEGALTRGQAARCAGGALLLAALVFLAFGYLDGTSIGADGYGRYSADLLALVNSGGRSTWLPGLPRGEGQYEGYGYLGAGVIAASLVAAAALLARRVRPTREALRRAAPLAVTVGLLGLYALSNRITLAGRTLLYVPFSTPITDALQSTGRFLWPLHYFVVLASLAVVLKLCGRRRGLAVALVGLVLAAQIAEQRGLRLGLGPRPAEPADPAWTLARGAYRRLVMVPPHLGGCAVPDEERFDLIPWAFLAHRIGATTNSIVLARVKVQRQRDYCAALLAELDAGRFDPEAIYLVGASQRARFAGARCGALDGHTVCLAPSRDDAFARALAAPPAP